MTTVLGGSGDGGSASGAGGGQSAAGTTTTTAANGGAATGQAGGTGTTGTVDGGGTPRTWHDDLPEDIRSDGGLRQFKDVATLAKSYVHARSLVGKKGVIVPTEKSGDDEWNGFFKSIGVPDLEKYQLTAPKDRQVDEARLTAFKQQAQKSGLLPKQAQALLDWQTTQEEEAVKNYQALKSGEMKKGLEELKKEWGEGFGKQTALAVMAVKELGGAEMQSYLETTGLGNDVKIIKLMAKAGALLGEDKIRGEGGGAFGQTPAEMSKDLEAARAEMYTLMKTPNDPRFKIAKTRVEDLSRKRFGT
jgi:hypothetical protein